MDNGCGGVRELNGRWVADNGGINNSAGVFPIDRAIYRQRQHPLYTIIYNICKSRNRGICRLFLTSRRRDEKEVWLMSGGFAGTEPEVGVIVYLVTLASDRIRLT